MIFIQERLRNVHPPKKGLLLRECRDIAGSNYGSVDFAENDVTRAQDDSKCNEQDSGVEHDGLPARRHGRHRVPGNGSGPE